MKAKNRYWQEEELRWLEAGGDEDLDELTREVEANEEKYDDMIRLFEGREKEEGD